MKKTKKSYKSVRVHKSNDPLKSPIMQVGIVFFMVMAFVLVAYAAKTYLP